MTFVASLSAFASVQFPTGYSRVADEKMEDYRKALIEAVNANPDVLAACNASWISDTFQNAEDILKNDQSGQPLLIFNRYYEVAESIIQRLIFTTDPSLKKVTKVDAEIYKKMEVNQGDLANPIFVEDYVLQGQWNCAKKIP